MPYTRLQTGVKGRLRAIWIHLAPGNMYQCISVHHPNHIIDFNSMISVILSISVGDEFAVRQSSATLPVPDE